MNAQEATQKFQQAEQSYAQKQYPQALHLLLELNQAFPNNQKILYPLALCLAAVGRAEDAAKACDILIEKFQDPRAQQLRAQLELPPSVEDIDISLDMDVLGDLGKRPPKLKQSAAPAARSAWPIYAAIAAVVVVAAAGFYLSGMGAKLGGLFKTESAETALANIMTASNALKSCAAGFDVSGNFPLPPPMGNMPITMKGNFEALKEGDKEMFRVEGAVDAAMMPGSTFKVFCDGKVVFIEASGMGQNMVLKQDISAAASQAKFDMNPADLMKEISALGKVTLKGSDTALGRLAYNFEVVPNKIEKSPIPNMPAIGLVKVAVDKQSGVPLKLEVLDTSNKAVVTATIKDLIIDVGVTADRFAYTPPSGVPVMDLSAMAGMMGGMGGMGGLPIPGMQ